MNLLIAGMSGWGKSWLAQAKAERNLPAIEYFIAFDYADEYRGLVETFDAVKWFPVGPREVDKPAAWWLSFIRTYEKVVLPRYMLTDKEWRAVAGRIAHAVRHIHATADPVPKTLLLIDEAHAVAPQRESYPEPIGKLAVAGRGENVSTLWVTQRLSMLDKDIVSQCHGQYIGGWVDPNDLSAISVEYPTDVHNPRKSTIATLPESLHAPDKGPIPVRQFTSEETLIGSEWIFSDERGTMRREDSRAESMKSNHYAHQGYRLEL